MKLIDIITGTRPNYMKVAPVIARLQQSLNDGGMIAYRLIHTGQHYSPDMSRVFQEELGMPVPDIDLEVGYCASPDDQLVAIIRKYRTVLQEQQPDMVIVVGDCTSTLACALATKLVDKKILLAHVEAGIRCGDREMLEELNRIVTDSVSDYFFTTTQAAADLLKAEAADPGNIFFVGNTMIDTLLNQAERFRKPAVFDKLSLTEKDYFVLTLHRRSNILSPALLRHILAHIMKASRGLPVIFPLHPHTARQLEQIKVSYPNLHIVAPMSYLEFNYLVQHARAVVTDSGGVSEETTVLNVPCMTLRSVTERPETCEYGTNVLVGTDGKKIIAAFNVLFDQGWKTAIVPDRWDGQAARRIVDIIRQVCFRENNSAQGSPVLSA